MHVLGVAIEFETKTENRVYTYLEQLDLLRHRR